MFVCLSFIYFFLFQSQIPNNIREIKLVGLHFRAVRPIGVSREAMADWQVGSEFKKKLENLQIMLYYLKYNFPFCNNIV